MKLKGIQNGQVEMVFETEDCRMLAQVCDAAARSLEMADVAGLRSCAEMSRTLFEAAEVASMAQHNMQMGELVALERELSTGGMVFIVPARGMGADPSTGSG